MRAPTFIDTSVDTWIAKFKFSTDLKVRVSETDLFAHINNTSYSIYFEQGRADYFAHFNLYDSGLMVVVGDIYCQFHQEGFIRDELSVLVRTSRFGTKSMTLESAIVRKSTGELISSNWTTLIMMDATTKKTVPIPESVKESIRKSEQTV